jgi:hypothetical protein
MRSSKPMCFVPSTFRLGSERDQGCLRWPEDGGLDASGQPGTLLGPSRATDTDDGDDHQSHQDHGFLPRHHARGDERVSGIATGSSRKAHADVRGTRSLRRDGRPPMRLGRSAADGDVEVGHDNHEGNRQGAHEHDEAEPTSHVRRLPGAGRRPDGAHGNNRNYFAQIPLLKSRCSNELLKRVAQTSCSNELLKRVAQTRPTLRAAGRPAVSVGPGDASSRRPDAAPAFPIPIGSACYTSRHITTCGPIAGSSQTSPCTTKPPRR